MTRRKALRLQGGHRAAQNLEVSATIRENESQMEGPEVGAGVEATLMTKRKIRAAIDDQLIS
jgi:hypothetical protein